jgi:hypothetical protein
MCAWGSAAIDRPGRLQPKHQVLPATASSTLAELVRSFCDLQLKREQIGLLADIR